MKNAWFKKFGWFHLPISWQGGVIVIFALIFLIQVFTAIDRHSHSSSDTLYGVFPYFAAVFLLYEWIAANIAEGKK